MESIDALAKAVNEFQGGLVLVSHDMRLISQVADQIWICDNKTIAKYDGDIQSFKMDMRREMGIGETVKLQGDASVKKKTEDAPKKEKKEQPPKLEVMKPTRPKPSDDATAVTATSAASSAGSLENSASNEPPKNRYIPPHLRRKMESS